MCHMGKYTRQVFVEEAKFLGISWQRNFGGIYIIEFPILSNNVVFICCFQIRPKSDIIFFKTWWNMFTGQILLKHTDFD